MPLGIGFHGGSSNAGGGGLGNAPGGGTGGGSFGGIRGGGNRTSAIFAGIGQRGGGGFGAPINQFAQNLTLSGDRVPWFAWASGSGPEEGADPLGLGTTRNAKFRHDRREQMTQMDILRRASTWPKAR
jgi:hypothetical protein